MARSTVKCAVLQVVEILCHDLGEFQVHPLFMWLCKINVLCLIIHLRQISKTQTSKKVDQSFIPDWSSFLHN